MGSRGNEPVESMTIREEFALAALEQIVAKTPPKMALQGTPQEQEALLEIRAAANGAVAYADALLRTLAGEPEPEPAADAPRAGGDQERGLPEQEPSPVLGVAQGDVVVLRAGTTLDEVDGCDRIQSALVVLTEDGKLLKSRHTKIPPEPDVERERAKGYEGGKFAGYTLSLMDALLAANRARFQKKPEVEQALRDLATTLARRRDGLHKGGCGAVRVPVK